MLTKQGQEMLALLEEQLQCMSTLQGVHVRKYPEVSFVHRM